MDPIDATSKRENSSCDDKSAFSNNCTADHAEIGVPRATPSPPKTAFMCFSISRANGQNTNKVRQEVIHSIIYVQI
jgi:hypothetical protein